jgi:hypothetical protein
MNVCHDACGAVVLLTLSTSKSTSHAFRTVICWSAYPAGMRVRGVFRLETKLITRPRHIMHSVNVLTAIMRCRVTAALTAALCPLTTMHGDVFGHQQLLGFQASAFQPLANIRFIFTFWYE